jgi:phosphoribosylglycinamide formyltransferase-1
MPEPIHLAILASGSGSNAASILEHFQSSSEVKVAFVGCNRPPEKAAIYERTRSFGMETEFFSIADLTEGRLLRTLLERGIDWVALAGFLARVPADFVRAFGGRMLNVHPSLLPKFGGQGMYGMHVHKAVIEAGESESGMTVHWVTEAYDEGAIVFQAACEVKEDDTPELLADRVLQMEHQYYPRAIAACIATATA